MTVGREDAFAEDTRAEQAVSLARKTRRRPATARGGLNGAARRSSDVEPELRFSGVRSPRVRSERGFSTNAPKI